MVLSRSVLQPHLFRHATEPIQVTSIHENDLSARLLDDLTSTSSGGLFGVAARYGSKQALLALAFSTSTHALSICLSSTPRSLRTKSKSGLRSRDDTKNLLETKILCHPNYRTIAFDAEKVSTALFFDFGLRIVNLVDAQSLSTKGARTSRALLYTLLGGKDSLNVAAVLKAFDRPRGDANDGHLVTRAWATCGVSTVSEFAPLVWTVPLVNTVAIEEEELMAIAKVVRDADRVSALKPEKVKNDVMGKFSFKSGNFNLELSRFKTRMRTAEKQVVVVETKIKGHKPVTTIGRVTGVLGKQASLDLPLSREHATVAQVSAVYTVGREDPTYAEDARVRVVLGLLQHTSRLLSHPLPRRIFLNARNNSRVRGDTSATISFTRPLNPSQEKAVKAILSEDVSKRLVMVQGPPGSGKTTAISAVVTSKSVDHTRKDQGIWLVGQSNVAVKNIAKKLVDVGFAAFKILLSFDFHFDWHEHLYKESLEPHVIRSDGFPHSVVDTESLLAGSKVLLCTLSMLSNPRLQKSGFTTLVPVDIVIIDEASQIDIGDYLPLLSRYGSTLRKIVFIGDDKQLAPFGQDDIGTLRSIFEVPNVRQGAIFLDTQYRMPTPIGNFISKHVYGGRLKSQHAIHDLSCCRFVDIAHGREEKINNGLKNVAEVNCVLRIAERYNKEGKSYTIITPYDKQRSAIETALKGANMPWEDRCFNVDSFQGNEDDHIIISVVRSDKLGFLKNIRRSNVMLSRCKKEMIICTSRGFISGSASGTLLGKLAVECGEGAWLSWQDVLNARW